LWQARTQTKLLRQPLIANTLIVITDCTSPSLPPPPNQCCSALKRFMLDLHKPINNIEKGRGQEGISTLSIVWFI